MLLHPVSKILNFYCTLTAIILAEQQSFEVNSIQSNNVIALERSKRDLFSITSVLTGILNSSTGVLDTISNGLKSVGSFLNISWFLDFFVGFVNIISTVLKVIQGIINLLSFAALIGQIVVNLNYIISYLLSGNLFAVGIYVVNLGLAIATYPKL